MGSSFPSMSSSTPQAGAGSQLAQLFAQNTGYKPAANPVAPIAAPKYPSPLTPSPAQAAMATQAAMQARMPMAAPVAAPRKPVQQMNYNFGRNGAASDR
jgi:hypothetical protein